MHFIETIYVFVILCKNWLRFNFCGALASWVWVGHIRIFVLPFEGFLLLLKPWVIWLRASQWLCSAQGDERQELAVIVKKRNGKSCISLKTLRKITWLSLKTTGGGNERVKEPSQLGKKKIVLHPCHKWSDVLHSYMWYTNIYYWYKTVSWQNSVVNVMMV